jgi:hypothetical protein
VSVSTMAKKKVTKAKPTEPEPPLGPRRTVLTIKGTDEWREWLEGLSDFLRTPTSTIVDHALVRYAKEMGYQQPAPKR